MPTRDRPTASGATALVHGIGSQALKSLSDADPAELLAEIAGLVLIRSSKWLRPARALGPRPAWALELGK